MLRVREEQLRLLEADARAGFLERLVRHFRRTWPEKAQALGGNLRPFLDNGLERAWGYGLTREVDVVRFINLMFVWGPDFDVSPGCRWAWQILHDPTLSGPVKVHQLVHRTSQELRQKEAAASVYGASS